MSADYIVSRRAELDVHGHALYLAERNLDAGLAFYTAVRAEFDRIAMYPHIGRRHVTRSRSLAGLRVRRITGFENYLVFYRPNVGVVEIARVLHGAQDLRRALRRG